MLQRMAFFVLVALVGAVGSVEASSTARADFDGSGRIDSADYALFYDAYGTMVGQDVFHPKFDLDADGVVGISDWMLFVDEWGKTTSAADTETDDILAARSDFDGTGLVDGLDYLLLITALKADFNLLFDLNADESVDMLDRDLFVEDWGKTVPKDLIPLCDRTPEVRDEILRLLGAGNTCDSVTRTALLALKDTLHLQDSGITALKVDDFAGLDSIRVLLLDNNALTTIEPHAFDSLKTIRRMYLRDNAITSIADSVFVNLDSLRTVDVTGNPGEPFPLRFSIKRLDARPASMARPAEIAIQVPFKVPKPFGLLFTARVENIGHGLYKKLTIPVRDTSVVFTFDTFETEESGWGYRGSDSNDPPYLLSIREHNLSSALRYGQNSYGGTYYGTYTKGGRGFYGFKAVTDSLCIYSEDCNSVIYRRTYAGGGSVPRGSGGGGGGTTTTPGTSNPGTGGTTTTPGTGNPGTGGTTTTPGTGNPGTGGGGRNGSSTIAGSRVTFSVNPSVIHETTNSDARGSAEVLYVFTVSPPLDTDLLVEVVYEKKEGDTAVYNTDHYQSSSDKSSFTIFSGSDSGEFFGLFDVIDDSDKEADVTLTAKATIILAHLPANAPNREIELEWQVTISDFDPVFNPASIPLEGKLTFDWADPARYSARSKEGTDLSQSFTVHDGTGNNTAVSAPEDLTLEIVSLDADRLMFVVDGVVSEKATTSFRRGAKVGGTVLRRHRYDYDSDQNEVAVQVSVMGTGSYVGSSNDLSFFILDTWPSAQDSLVSLSLSPSKIFPFGTVSVEALVSTSTPFAPRDFILEPFKFKVPNENGVEYSNFSFSGGGGTEDKFAFPPGDDGPKVISFDITFNHLVWKSRKGKTLGFIVDRDLRYGYIAGRASLELMDTNFPRLKFSPSDTLEIVAPATSASVAVKLPARPDNDVTVTLLSSVAEYEYAFGNNAVDSLVFTPNNWNVAQNVTFTIPSSRRMSGGTPLYYSGGAVHFFIESDYSPYYRESEKYYVFDQIRDLPRSIRVQTTPPASIFKAVDLLASHWDVLAVPKTIPSPSEFTYSGTLRGFGYDSFEFNSPVAAKKFSEFAKNACIRFSSPSLTVAGGVAVARWDATEGYWKFPTPLTSLSDLALETHSERITIEVRKDCP